ncbi:hypothetical protein VXN63_02265 [Marinilactibacillus sp. XAAS-LB27]|uniref:DUF6877 family protein n=1 Tax=Marinilactibacillus sp. XAAS-LB27 TaxID=3114538 RepID=UPI002E18F192|nr:DUF6877 family protein [Marinilactibacillus sp. XAAS-LB27]MEC6747350.1 hypothetical protein [Marinilactibacillus sp. XAAS-LB27]
MSYSERLSNALDKLPDSLALAVSQDVDKRISDWLAVEGHKENDPYILQQVRFAENVVKRYEKAVDA